MPVKTQPNVEPELTVYELSQTAEFRSLSPKMATWVLTYCSGYLETGIFDPLAATLSSCPKCKTPEIARTFGYQLLSNPKVRRTIELFTGRLMPAKTSTETRMERAQKRLLKKVQKALREAKPGIAQQKLLDQEERLILGIKMGRHTVEERTVLAEMKAAANDSPTEPTKFYVGQRVAQRDTETGILHIGIVRTLDGAGLPDKIEEIS